MSYARDIYLSFGNFHVDWIYFLVCSIDVAKMYKERVSVAGRRRTGCDREDGLRPAINLVFFSYHQTSNYIFFALLEMNMEIFQTKFSGSILCIQTQVQCTELSG